MLTLNPLSGKIRDKDIRATLYKTQGNESSTLNMDELRQKVQETIADFYPIFTSAAFNGIDTEYRGYKFYVGKPKDETSREFESIKSEYLEAKNKCDIYRYCFQKIRELTIDNYADILAEINEILVGDNINFMDSILTNPEPSESNFDTKKSNLAESLWQYSEPVKRNSDLLYTNMVLFEYLSDLYSRVSKLSAFYTQIDRTNEIYEYTSGLNRDMDDLTCELDCVDSEILRLKSNEINVIESCYNSWISEEKKEISELIRSYGLDVYNLNLDGLSDILYFLSTHPQIDSVKSLETFFDIKNQGKDYKREYSLGGVLNYVKSRLDSFKHKGDLEPFRIIISNQLDLTSGINNIRNHHEEKENIMVKQLDLVNNQFDDYVHNINYVEAKSYLKRRRELLHELEFKKNALQDPKILAEFGLLSDVLKEAKDIYDMYKRFINTDYNIRHLQLLSSGLLYDVYKTGIRFNVNNDTLEHELDLGIDYPDFNKPIFTENKSSLIPSKTMIEDTLSKLRFISELCRR